MPMQTPQGRCRAWAAATCDAQRLLVTLTRLCHRNSAATRFPSPLKRRSMTAAGAATDDRRRIAFAYAALVVGAIAMGASPIFVRLADVGPYASAFWRTALALPFLYAWMKLEDAGRAPAWPRLDRQLVLCGLLFTGDLFFWH